MNGLIRGSMRATLYSALASVVLAASAHAAQICLTNAQQARTSSPIATSLRVNNPSNVVTCNTAGTALVGAWQTGDFRLVIITLDTPTALTVTAPDASWTPGIDGHGGRVQHSVFWKTISGTPNAFEEFSWPDAVPAIMSVMNFRNVNATNPIRSDGMAGGGLAATQITGPARGAGANGDMHVMILAHVGRGANAATITTPGGVSPSYATTGCVSGGRCGRLWGSNAGLDADGDGTLGNDPQDERLSLAQYVRPTLGAATPQYAWPSNANSKRGITLVLRRAP